MIFFSVEAISAFDCGIATDDKQLKEVKSVLQEARCKLDRSKCSDGDGKGGQTNLFFAVWFHFLVLQSSSSSKGELTVPTRRYQSYRKPHQVQME